MLSMVKIQSVDKNSPADKAGLKAGMSLVSINGQKVIDVLDIAYFETESKLDFEVSHENKVEHFTVKNRNFEPLGIELCEQGQLNPIRCRNKCLFCFVDQLPKNMRDTLYVKDDDYRLSMVSGNYVTLTNVGDEEIERIIRLHLSPIYVSIHAYDDDIRTKLVTNPNARYTMDKVRRLVNAGITIHGQVVMCKGINDGEVLRQTITELNKLYPRFNSLAVIPVGLTGHRSSLFELEPIDKKSAIDTINLVQECREQCLKKGSGFVWCSDEFYIKAGMEIPDSDYYEDYSQIENGVGLIRQYEDDLNYALGENVSRADGKAFDLATGVSFYPFLSQYAKRIREATGASLNVHQVYNDFFGRSITVAGLLTGGDLVSQLKGNLSSDRLILPRNMFKQFEDVFLDGLTLSDFENELNVKVDIVSTPSDLIEVITGD